MSPIKLIKRLLIKMIYRYIVYPDELYHYGVKGMRWGYRKQRPVGPGRSSWGMARQMAREVNVQRQQNWKRSNAQNLSAHEQKMRRRAKVARAALIVAGSAMMGVAVHKAVRDPKMRKYVVYAKNKLSGAATNGRRTITANYYKASNIARNARKIAGTPMRMIGQSRAGRIALKAYGTAATISDANSTYQWAKKMKQQGHVTRSDVGSLAKDLINPLPDNLPKIRKKR